MTHITSQNDKLKYENTELQLKMDMIMNQNQVIAS